MLQKIVNIFKACKRPRFKSLHKFYATESKFKIEPYVLHRFQQSPSPDTTLTTNDALDIYEQMVMIRKLENELNKLYKAKKVRGFCHLYSGQEAVAVGIYAALRPQDAAITSYRCHAWAYLYQNKIVDAIIAELMGFKSGSQKGKGGSMHVYAKNFYGGNGIVGAQVPLGAGIALAYKYKNTDGICVTLYGDGAANNGQVSETFNMAKLWSLPCLFVCENNQFAMGTSLSRSSANPNYYTKGDAIPGIKIDGMDILTVREATRFLVEYISSGKGPVLMEADTYRYSGHSLSDPGTSYRTPDEIKKVREARDPITTFKKKILSADLTTEKDLKEIDLKTKTILEKSLNKALKDQELPLEELTYDIYSNDVIKEVRGVSPWKKLIHKTSPSISK